MTEQRLRLHEQAWARANDEFRNACEVEPTIYEALEHAQAADGDLRRGLVAVAAGMLAPHAPSLPIEAWRDLLWAIVTGGELRTTYIPGIPERTLWVTRSEDDAEALRNYVAPGQVWVRTDHLKSDEEWRLAKDHARYASARDLGRRPSSGGRPSGRTNTVRDGLVAAVKAQPGMTDDQIDALGVELGIWTPAEGDYDTKAKRLKRLREDARLR